MSIHYAVSVLCDCLHINRSSYYYYQKAKPLWLEKELPDKLLIEEIFNKHKKLADYRTTRMDLEKMGITMNCKKIRRIMNKYDIKTQVFPQTLIIKKCKQKIFSILLINETFNVTFPSSYSKFLTNMFLYL